MSINIVADNYVRADEVTKFLELAKIIVQKTNANDPGCIKYNIFRDKNDPTHFVMLEEWTDQESLDAHMRAPHFTELIPQMGAFASKPGGIGIYENVF
jgi:quinol monooxygenase YgiN